MSKRDDLKIDIMSSIDDDIIEKHTKKRIELINGRRTAGGRKITVALVAVVVCLSVLMSVMIGLLQDPGPTLPDDTTGQETTGHTESLPSYPPDHTETVPSDPPDQTETAPTVPMGRVPVYQGMTVSNQAPDVVAEAKYPNVSFLSAITPRPSTVLNSVMTAVVKNGSDVESVAAETDGLHDDPTEGGTDRALYYAKPNADIYIHIHINNPDQFEILSFTLNGVKYQSYMFEPGSDSETLILKVNVGDEGRFVEYTIDAIKYIEGAEIKDVIMDGEKTVRVAITPEEQPTVEIEDVAYGFLDVSFSAKINDPLALIETSHGVVRATLYDGDEIVGAKALTVEKINTVVFDGLECNKKYTLRINAYYDAIDGEGFSAHVIEEVELTTQNLVDIGEVISSKGALSFELVVPDGFGITIEKTELVRADGSVIESVDGKASTFNTVDIGEYKVIVTYSYDLKGARVDSVNEITVENTTFGLSLPVVGPISKEYSPNKQMWFEAVGGYRTHSGIDIAAKLGTPVFAAAGGKIVKVWDDALMGRCVAIDHGDDKFTVYKNLDEQLADGIAAGKEIKRGDRIGSVGNTSLLELSEEPHFHFEMTENSFSVNPMDYFCDKALEEIVDAGKTEAETDTETDAE